VAATATPANAAPGGGSGGGGANLTVPITGSCDTATGAVECFDGTFTLTRFTSSGGVLQAVGTLAGTFTDPVTGVQTAINQSITLPADATGTCEILDLTLGPLDLDLLGLVVHLDQVHLNITAESGPGNLLGNLLCGVAGLLDQGVPTNQLANLLNQILALLG